jgi:hypothetical protein
LSERLDRTIASLAAAKAATTQLEGRNHELVGKLSEQLVTITSLKVLADRQRAEIDRLTDRLGQSESRITSLRDSLVTLAHGAAAAHWVAAGRADLLAKGVAVEEGGLGLPFFGRGGAALVPARTIPAAAFATIDRYADTAITLPKPDHSYRLVSRHDLRYLRGATATGVAVFKGTVTITAPEVFWAQSPYLIFEELPTPAELWP